MKKMISAVLTTAMLISINSMLINAEIIDFEMYNDTCDTSTLETMKISSDAKINITTSSEEFISRLLTSTEFTFDGTVTVSGKKININEYYDFDSAYKLDIVDWAREIGLITESEKIETYCDLILDGEDNGVDCWNPYSEQIIAYAENNLISSKLQEKINAVLYTETNPSARSSNRTFYYTDNFAIEYNPGAISRSKIVSVGDYFEDVRTFYKNQGYQDVILGDFEGNDSENPDEKYLVKIYAPSEEDKGGADCTRKGSGRTCTSEINIFSFSELSNRVKHNIAHEYFHAIQNSYNWHVSWFKEAAANWAMIWYDKTIPLSDDNLRRFNAYLTENTPLDVHTSVETNINNYGQGKAFFPLAIHRKFGADTMLEIYEAYASYNNNGNNAYVALSYSDIRTIISTGIGTANGGFDRALRAMAAYNTDPGRWYASLYNYANTFVNPRSQTISVMSTSYSYGSSSQPMTLLHSTSAYYICRLDISGYSKLTIQLTFLNDTNSRGRCQLYVENEDGTRTISYPTISNSTTTLTSGDISDGKIFGIIVTNATANYTTVGNDEVPLQYTVTVTAIN